MNIQLNTLYSCTSCTAVISRGGIIKPLYHCVKCTSARHKLYNLIQRLGFSSLADVLLPHVRDWTTTTTTGQRTTPERLDPASVFVVHSLVLSTEESTSQDLSCSILKNAWKMLVHSQESAQDSKLGKILREVTATWVRALPLISCPNNRENIILKTVSDLMDHDWRASHPKVRLLQTIGSAVQDTFPTMKRTTKPIRPNSAGKLKSSLVWPHRVSRKRKRVTTLISNDHDGGGSSSNILLDSLSLDVLGVIFGFLSPPRIMWGCAMVNKRLASSCRDNLLWKRIYQTKFPLVKCSSLCLPVNSDSGAHSDDSHDWRDLYMKRRAAAKRVRLKGWKLSTRFEKQNTKSRRAKIKRKRYGKKTVVMCKCCGCNFVSSTEKLMLLHCESEHAKA